MTEAGFSIDLPVTTEWSNVEQLRASLNELVRLVSQDHNAGHAVSLVAAELAENAIKYGYWAEDPKVLRVRVWGELPVAHVLVENPVAPGSAVPVELARALAFIERFPSAREAYEAKVAAKAGGEVDGSGLGLVRLSYEANCTLQAEVVGEVLRLRADLELEGEDHDE